MQFYLAFMLTVGLKKFAPTGVCAISPIASVSRARIGSRSLRLAEAAFTVGHSPRVTGAKPSSPMPSTTCLELMTCRLYHHHLRKGIAAERARLPPGSPQLHSHSVARRP